MPTVEWNKSWAQNLKEYKRGVIPGAHYGDQWGDPEERADLKTVVSQHLSPFIKHDLVALEIGSGGGRWTQYLLACQKVYCVELNADMFDYIKQRFPAADNIEYVQTNGSDLPGVEENTVDFAFSFGVLVHCDAPIIEGYLNSLYKVMKSGGRAHLQFSDKRKPNAARNPDFANTTPESFSKMATEAGFSVDVMDETTMGHSAIVQLEKR